MLRVKLISGVAVSDNTKACIIVTLWQQSAYKWPQEWTPPKKKARNPVMNFCKGQRSKPGDFTPADLFNIYDNN